MQSNSILFGDEPRKVQPHAKGAELDRHGGEVRPALDHRKRKLAASNKARRLAVERQNVRLRKNLEDVALLEILNRGSQIQIGPEQEVATIVLRLGVDYLLLAFFPSDWAGPSLGNSRPGRDGAAGGEQTRTL